MNIYFACSITGGREFETVYQAIVNALLADGHEVPTAHLAQPNVSIDENFLAPRAVYDRDVDWIENCDVMVAEVSVPSHGVGYEIGFAINAGKRVCCLYRNDRKVSKMITGNPHPSLTIETYPTVEQALSIVHDYLSKQNQYL
jgi:nucleoside 2-deoxyribosyltransferase